MTGGNGKIGRALLKHLNEHGYETANVARGKRREEISDTYVTADLLDAGETYGALAKTGADAVIHMGTIPGPNTHPEYRTYESNVMSAMYVLEASQSLGLESCCLASSINAMGAEHQRRDPEVEYLPIDESHPRTPDDIYGIAKHAMEVTADGYGRRPDNHITISTLRYPWVLSEEEFGETFAESDRSMATLRNNDPWSGKEVMFSYLHIDDACAIARKAVEAQYRGHETFWAVAGDTTAAEPTADVAAEFYPDATVCSEFQGHETLFDLSKADTMLDWRPQHSWRDF
ncbi:NAD-dependent epimerase/dehydratase family protein [Haloarcula marina]|uniref:NAD-dependent epimerase/dehydratase family protein n=1 Tax=Haloarcula marina TaxID=2961574 RepID=UPI0020B833D2|nr:NAD(P)-dependent oxidoreductase [Halomicroarcula marina]